MNEQQEKMRGFYRFHARIYEATRWTFLFGRKEVVERLKLPMPNNLHLLEIGCGTGHNLKPLAEQHPNMKFTGIDVAPEMLEISKKMLAKFLNRTRLLELVYGQDLLPTTVEKPQIILISYCLTMVNPGWDDVIRQAAKDLQPGGKIAVVDFHRSRFSWFRRWMQFNHVRMDGQLLPVLEKNFKTVYKKVQPAYFGVWEYFVFVGEKMEVGIYSDHFKAK